MSPESSAAARSLAASGTKRVTAVPAGEVEPGETVLLVGALAPLRVWWRTAHDSYVDLLLEGSATDHPRTVRLTPSEHVLVVGRGQTSDHEDLTAQVAAACRGAMWLARQGDVTALSAADLGRLLEHHRRLSNKSAAASLRDILDGMPTN